MTISREMEQGTRTTHAGGSIKSFLIEALVLRAVVSQQLVPTKAGGVTPTFEIMVANTAIRNLIREEKTYQIDSVIASSGNQSMHTMDQDLFSLVQRDIVDREVTLQRAIHPEALRNHLRLAGL